MLSAAGVRALPRRSVRRAQGRRPGDPRHRPRAVAARQRQRRRAEQRLHLARAVPRGARRVVPRERPHAAADGRASASTRTHGPGDGSALTAGTTWPNAGFADLGRIKQAFWDAFRDTPQPTTVDGLKLYLDEVGWQVDTSSLPGYTGIENVPVTDERTQAAVYADLVRSVGMRPARRRGQHLRLLRRRVRAIRASRPR